MMKIPKHTDVIVVGAGPVGLFTALCLRRQGLAVEIFDPLPNPAAHSYALALHAESLALLDSMGVLERLRPSLHLMRKIELIPEQGEAAVVDLNYGGLAFPFIAVTPQAALEEALAATLREAGVIVRWGHRIGAIENGSRKVKATAYELEERTIGYSVGHSESFVRRERPIEAAFMVGADGHESLVRRSLEIDFPEVGLAQRFAVFEFTGSASGEEAMEIFHSREGLVSVKWPLGPRAWRWSFEVGEDFVGPLELRHKNPDFAQIRDRSDFAPLCSNQLESLVAKRIPHSWNTLQIDNLYWRVLVQLERRLATKFGRGRAWLVGDAAHLAGPVGVHSMNIGLREGHDLADRLSTIIDAQASLDLLEDYDLERQNEWGFLHRRLGRIRPGPAVHPDLAQRGDAVLGWLPASGYKLASLAHRFGFEIEEMPMGSGEIDHRAA
jgi:2-polyprenyl-6-methoxyphenol hydroxylase-like FAD-dependent oxidoreductase